MALFDTYIKCLAELAQVDTPVTVEVATARRVHDEACRAADAVVPNARALREQATMEVDGALKSSREILAVLDLAAIIPKKRRPATVEGGDVVELRALAHQVEADVVALRQVVDDLLAARKRRDEVIRLARAAALERQKLEREAAERKRLEDAETSRLAAATADRRRRTFVTMAVVGAALLIVLAALVVMT